MLLAASKCSGVSCPHCYSPARKTEVAGLCSGYILFYSDVLLCIFSCEKFTADYVYVIVFYLNGAR